MTNSLANQATNLIKEVRKLGLKVKSTKAKVTLFRAKEEIALKIDNTDIITAKSVQFLGITLDHVNKHSSYHEHIKELAQKQIKTL